MSIPISAQSTTPSFLRTRQDSNPADSTSPSGEMSGSGPAPAFAAFDAPPPPGTRLSRLQELCQANADLTGMPPEDHQEIEAFLQNLQLIPEWKPASGSIVNLKA